MRSAENCFHLAIPCSDLDLAEDFYARKIGCQLGRRYHDRITLNFFGDQVVCHLDPDRTEKNPRPYPRHFGITFRKKDDFDSLHGRIKNLNLPFFEELNTRFEGKREEHFTFMILDPSNNVLEFKHYRDPEMMY